ncbi:phycobilisome linker polypeptide [Myxosarcina sp. GI1]|uniref:phycobilisome linker polypeptide n=1 Tax=Myxosarcina sp. GI1 TaxID=1541065 RepID=UPI0005642551|nr:phycobilisome linker polypeptide [Myxosarcina sp. GI1]
MLGNSAINGRSSSPAQNRVFVYEVTGLKQNEANDSINYPFRRSSSVFVTVPYNRMNEEMQRINKMGGTIVKIQSLDSFQNSSNDEKDTEDSKE